MYIPCMLNCELDMYLNGISVNMYFSLDYITFNDVFISLVFLFTLELIVLNGYI